MPIFDRTLKYRVSNIHTVNKCKNLGILCSIKDIITIDIETLKLITPNNKKLQIHCQCDKCKNDFYSELRSITMNNIKTNIINCQYCNRQDTMIKRYGVKYSGESDILLAKSLHTKLIKSIENPDYIINITEKRKKTNLDRYGVKYPTQLDSIKNKGIKTLQSHYGEEYTCAFQIPEIRKKSIESLKINYNILEDINSPCQIDAIKEKVKQTNLDKYGTTCVLLSEEVKQKVLETIQRVYGKEFTSTNQVPEIKAKKIKTLQSHYGERYTNSFQIPEIRDKINKTRYNNGTINTSKQQLYFYNLFGGKINYPVGNVFLDIAFIEEKIDVEYNGGGHNLPVKLNIISEEEFLQKEIRRNKFIRGLGWKQIFINSPNDKINLFNDFDYLKLLQISKDFLLNNSNRWIELNLEDNLIKSSNFSEKISQILKMNYD